MREVYTFRSREQALSCIAGAIKVCEAKKVFASRGLALRFADKAVKDGLSLTPYQCPICDEWHLTSQRRAQSAT